jgi:hypothetical protein
MSKREGKKLTLKRSRMMPSKKTESAMVSTTRYWLAGILRSRECRMATSEMQLPHRPNNTMKGSTIRYSWPDSAAAACAIISSTREEEEAEVLDEVSPSGAPSAVESLDIFDGGGGGGTRTLVWQKAEN